MLNVDWQNCATHGYLPPNVQVPVAPTIKRHDIDRGPVITAVELGKVGLGLRLSKDLKVDELL